MCCNLPSLPAPFPASCSYALAADLSSRLETSLPELLAEGRAPGTSCTALPSRPAIPKSPSRARHGATTCPWKVFQGTFREGPGARCPGGAGSPRWPRAQAGGSGWALCRPPPCYGDRERCRCRGHMGRGGETTRKSHGHVATMPLAVRHHRAPTSTVPRVAPGGVCAAGGCGPTALVPLPVPKRGCEDASVQNVALGPGAGERGSGGARRGEAEQAPALLHGTQIWCHPDLVPPGADVPTLLLSSGCWGAVRLGVMQTGWRKAGKHEARK